MRGRFVPDGSLYSYGMFAWAGNATAPGGFHRILRGSKTTPIPIDVHAAKGMLILTLNGPMPSAEAAMKVWSLKRTANYGSKHHDEKHLTIVGIKLGEDQRMLVLEIPDLAPTQCYELKVGASVLHGTIHELR